MSLRTLFLLGLLLFPIYIFAGIPGTYRVSGFDPATNEKYTGTAVITTNGSVYSIVWTFSNDSVVTGTGVRKNDYLSFVFTENDTGLTLTRSFSAYGTQLYKIDDDGHTLKGPWVRADAEHSGWEVLKKVKHQDH